MRTVASSTGRYLPTSMCVCCYDIYAVIVFIIVLCMLVKYVMGTSYMLMLANSNNINVHPHIYKVQVALHFPYIR